MKQRLVFVDLFRGWAALVMIEVHVFNAFILPSIKEEAWFGLLNYVNGLVAPAFLFISGFVFVLTSERKLDEFRTFGNLFWKQLQRIALVWTIGYALHLPFFSFIRILRETDERGWLKFYQADILHCIALGLTILFFLRIVIADGQRYQRALLWISGALVLGAPVVWEVDFNRWIPAPFGAYLNGQHVSQFPAFNWLAFLTVGGISAIRFAEAKKKDREFDFFNSLTYLGAGLIVGGSVIRELPIHVPLVSDAIRANPFFFAERVGLILVLLTLCWWYARVRKTDRSLVIDASKESLMVYAGHLLVIFGQFSGETSLWSLYGGQLSLVDTCVATLALTFAFVFAARLWTRMKSSHPSESRKAAYAFFTVVVVLFFIRAR